MTLTTPSVKKAPADQTGPKQTENKEWPLAPLLFSTLPQTPKLQGNSSRSNGPSWHQHQMLLEPLKRHCWRFANCLGPKILVSSSFRLAPVSIFFLSRVCSWVSVLRDQSRSNRRLNQIPPHPPPLKAIYSSERFNFINSVTRRPWLWKHKPQWCQNNSRVYFKSSVWVCVAVFRQNGHDIFTDNAWCL